MLTFSENNKDLGKMKEGESLAFAVQVRNEGSSPLQIDTISAGCQSCTSAGLTGNPVDTQIPSTLHITFKPTSKGINIKTVKLKYTENGKEETLIFTFRATVI